MTFFIEELMVMLLTSCNLCQDTVPPSSMVSLKVPYYTKPKEPTQEKNKCET